MVDTATKDGSPNAQRTAAGQQRNVDASKKGSSMSTADKNKFIKDINTKMVNPENPSGVSGMATMQKANVEASQGKPRQTVDFGTPAAQKALDKASTE